MFNALKSLSTPVKILFILAVAGLLACLALITPPARSALTYITDPYTAQFQQSHLGVTLVEATGSEEAPNNIWREVDGAGEMLPVEKLVGESGSVVPGSFYQEKISVRNNSDTAEYVRLTIRAFWATPDDGQIDAQAAKNPAYDPAFIELAFADSSQWLYSEKESTAERMVFYLKNALEPGATASEAIEGFVISEKIVPYLQDYNGARIAIDAQVDSVQTGNAVDAAKSAWGVNVESLGLDWSGE